MASTQVETPQTATAAAALPDGNTPRDILESLADGGRALGAFVVLALAVKLLVVMAAWGDDPLARHPTSDSFYYLERAAGIAGRIDDPLAHEPYHLPPLYPQLLARVPGALDASFAGVYILQAVFGTLSLVGVYLLARRRASRQVALGAAAFTLLYGPLTFFEMKLLGDSLACSVLILVLVITDRLADGFATKRTGEADTAGSAPDPKRLGSAMSLTAAATLGLMLGLATLLRPQILLLIPLLVGWLMVRRARLEALACALTAVLALVPSTLHNVSAGAGLTPVSDNGGVNLWLANTGPLSGTFLSIDEAFGDIGRQARSARRVAEGMAGHALSPGEVSDTLRAAAWESVLADPARFLNRVGLRAQASLESFETGIVCVPEVEAGLMGPLAILAMPFGVFLALGGAAFVILCGRRRRPRDDSSDELPATPLLPMLALAGVVLLTTLLFFHYSRFRLPWIPLLAIATACAVTSVQRRGLTPGRAVLALAAAGALAWIAWLPGQHHEDTLAIGWTSVAEARLALASRSQRSAALIAADEDMARALEHAPGLLRARLQAHHVAMGLRHFEEALRHLDVVAEVLPDHSQVLMNRAWLHVWQDSANPYYDLAAARVLVDRLHVAALLDPDLTEHVNRLESALQSSLKQSPVKPSQH